MCLERDVQATYTTWFQALIPKGDQWATIADVLVLVQKSAFEGTAWWYTHHLVSLTNSQR